MLCFSNCYSAEVSTLLLLLLPRNFTYPCMVFRLQYSSIIVIKLAMSQSDAARRMMSKKWACTIEFWTVDVLCNFCLTTRLT